MSNAATAASKTAGSPAAQQATNAPLKAVKADRSLEALQSLIDSSKATLTEAEARAAGFGDIEIEKVKGRLRKVEQMSLIRTTDAEFSRVDKVCIAHENTIPSDLMRQDYWAHIAPSLPVWTRLEVRANDRSWMWEGVVLDSGRNWAVVHQLALHHFGDAELARSNAAIAAEYIGQPYEVRFRGEFELWSVIRKSDQAVMSEKHATKADADKYVRERQQADRVPA